MDTIPFTDGDIESSSSTISGEALVDEYYYGATIMVRLLQNSGQRGRTVLTVLYLCVLGLCFVVPIIYYFRMHFEERHVRRLRELEIEGITQALEQSQDVHREETRAARRKFREERKARINQLFAPVKMELKAENFPHLREAKQNLLASSDNHSIEIEQGTDDNINSSKMNLELSSEVLTVEESARSMDEDQLFVEVPSPGFQLVSTSVIVGRFTNRLVPNVCSICLSNYAVGNTIVWSSNEACDHVFHEGCILQWLMKQRDGPLCPCCRRDFVLDPYDMEDIDPADLDAGPINPAVGVSLLFGSDTVPVDSANTATPPEAIVAQQLTNVATRMEEGLSSTSSNASASGNREFSSNASASGNRESGFVDPQQEPSSEGS